MRCRICDYSLKNLSSHRCPECGRAFDPDDPATYASGSTDDALPKWMSVLCGLFFTVLAGQMLYSAIMRPSDKELVGMLVVGSVLVLLTAACVVEFKKRDIQDSQS